MKENLKVQGSVIIFTTPEKLWKVLTGLDTIRRYLFGSVVKTDWKKGSDIWFSRQYEGKKYIDKGKILEIIENNSLKYSFFNSQEGYEDTPENYSTIEYSILKKNDHEVELRFSREYIPIEFERKNQEEYLPHLLKQIKAISEE